MPGLKKTALKPSARLLLAFLFFSLATSLRPQNSEEQPEPTEPESHLTVTMGSSLWETLVDNGVNPSIWKYVFEYNRANNPAFARITRANRIPRGTVIFIPLERDEEALEKRKTAPSRPSRSTVEDTVKLLDGIQFIRVRPGRGQSLADVITQFCIPASVRSNQNRLILRRNIYSDLRDTYRRMGSSLSYRDPTFLLPDYLAADQLDSLQRRIEYFQYSLQHFIPRDSLLELSPGDIRHVAAAGEDYRSLAKLYFADADAFPASYPYKKYFSDHLAYMSQQIRAYNFNQPVWPGNAYYIPGYLVTGDYFRRNSEVKLEPRTKDYLTYRNGLMVSLEYHVTRRKAYWRRRQQYLPPMERQLSDGRKAYPDMLLWHRTGLDPEVEEALRNRHIQNFSVRYIHRMAVSNYYISESGQCFLIVDPDKNSRDHAGSPADYRCLWNGVSDVSDVSIGVEIEGGFLTPLSSAQLETARKLQEVLRGIYIIPDDRLLDHRKVACRRGPGPALQRGRKSDGLTTADRQAIGIRPILDPDVLRGLVDPNLNEQLQRQADSTDYWYKVEIDPDLEATARKIGWQLSGDRWVRQDSTQAGLPKSQPAAF